MKSALPKKLKKEPLIDAICEIRFIPESSDAIVSEILPGIFFGQLTGNKSIVSLPASQLPKALRDSDPALMFTPTIQVIWNNFYINIGNRSISIGGELPYPGWFNFKQAIIDVLDIVQQSNLLKSVERCSVKYIDLLESINIAEQINFLNFSCQLGGQEIQQPFTFRTENKNDDIINIIQLIASVKVDIKKQGLKEGLIVDVDTIMNMENILFPSFMKSLASTLERLHEVNKKTFFGCLKKETIQLLEPIYE
ncbi:MAG: TIGR04255 family protein [Gammaproteobacteria bacterium]